MQQGDNKILKKMLKVYTDRLRGNDIQFIPAVVGQIKDHIEGSIMGECRQLCNVTAEKEIPLQGKWKFSRFHTKTHQRASMEGASGKTNLGVVGSV
jgi:hypothetical protein